jgi:hypothetical protein
MLLGAVLLAAVAAAGTDPDAGLTDLDRRVLEVLVGRIEAGPIVVHYDPASVPGDDAAAEAGRARESLAALEKRLEVRYGGAAHVFLYRDAAEFRARTGARPEWGAFAQGPRSLHLPKGAPLRHELTHLLAHRFAGLDGRDPGGLLREGLAAAMEEGDRGVPVGSWAAVYARLGVLPALGELRDRWPDGPPREVHPYHAAGSFVDWLLVDAGVAKVKALYAEPSKAKEILGRGWEELEAAWRAALDARPVPDAEWDEVHRGLLLPVGRLPPALAKDPGTALFDGKSLEGWKPSHPGIWAAAGGLLRGEGRDSRDGRWRHLETGRSFAGAVALRATVRPASAGASLLLRVNRDEGRSDEALFTPDGCGVTLRGGIDGLARAPVRLLPGRWTEVVLAQEGGTARLYLDGRLVVEAKDAFGAPGGAVGFGVRDGVVDVRDAAVILPPK